MQAVLETESNRSGADDAKQRYPEGPPEIEGTKRVAKEVKERTSSPRCQARSLVGNDIKVTPKASRFGCGNLKKRTPAAIPSVSMKVADKINQNQPHQTYLLWWP